MKKSTFPAFAGAAAFACGLAFASGAASAQGIGAGLQGKADPAPIQQKIQEQTQQRIQAQAEAQARVRAEAQAQQAAARMQQRVEAQAQNQAARAQAQGERALGTVQQRIDAAAQRNANASLGAEASTGLRVGQQTVRARTQADAGVDASDESGTFFGPWNPIRAAAGIGSSTNARTRANGDGGPAEQTPSTESDSAETEPRRPSRGLAVGQYTDLRGTARAELARSMALRLTAISAMRDRAIETEDLQLLEKADRLEGVVRRVLEARGQGQVDAEAEATVEAELPVSPTPEAPIEVRSSAGAELAPSATFAPTQP